MLEPSQLLIGESASLRAFREELGYAARCDARVLITGHSDCDAESVARLLHQQSRRSRAPVVAVTCLGVSDRRLESELFGEVVSGSAGAPQRQPGLAELADGGVLILTGIEETQSADPGAAVSVLRNGRSNRDQYRDQTTGGGRSGYRRHARWPR